jgi:hypothetical protein
LKTEYWDVSDDQIVSKTGHPLAYWVSILKEFGAHDRNSTESVEMLQSLYGVQRYWARTLTTHYLKAAAE